MTDPVPAPEQQGEPVCVRCGHDRTVWQHHSTPLREMMAAYEIHPFEPPAPPSSEEAEALARLFHETYERLAPSYGYHTRPESAVQWDDVPQPNKELMLAVARVVGTAIRRPLEERVRALERVVSELDADREPLKAMAAEVYNRMLALEEERDRLREELRIALANQDTLAQVVDMDGPLDRAVARAEAAEAQVAKLREALGHIQKRIDVQGPTGVPLLIEISAHIRGSWTVMSGTTYANG